MKLTRAITFTITIMVMVYPMLCFGLEEVRSMKKMEGIEFEEKAALIDKRQLLKNETTLYHIITAISNNEKYKNQDHFITLNRLLRRATICRPCSSTNRISHSRMDILYKHPIFTCLKGIVIFLLDYVSFVPASFLIIPFVILNFNSCLDEICEVFLYLLALAGAFYLRF